MPAELISSCTAVVTA